MLYLSCWSREPVSPAPSGRPRKQLILQPAAPIPSGAYRERCQSWRFAGSGGGEFRRHPPRSDHQCARGSRASRAPCTSSTAGPLGAATSVSLQPTRSCVAPRPVTCSARPRPPPTSSHSKTTSPRSLVVGAPGALNGRGIVYVFAGVRSGDSLTAANAVVQILGAPGDQLGTALATGDLNNDGYREIIIGAPGTHRVYVVGGGTYLTGNTRPVAVPSSGRDVVRRPGPWWIGRLRRHQRRRHLRSGDRSTHHQHDLRHQGTQRDAATNLRLRLHGNGRGRRRRNGDPARRSEWRQHHRPHRVSPECGRPE